MTGDRELEELRRRVAELERKIEVLFTQTGATDWAAEARLAPAVSEEVRELLERGDNTAAAKRYMAETGAGIGETAAALGEVAKGIRGD